MRRAEKPSLRLASCWSVLVVKGGAAVGRSEQMPAYPHLAEQPEVLAAIVRHMRQFGR